VLLTLYNPHTFDIAKRKAMYLVLPHLYNDRTRTYEASESSHQQLSGSKNAFGTCQTWSLEEEGDTILPPHWTVQI
jgi:hypothetical protein